MSLRFTAAHSSRITKSKSKSPLTRRPSASPLGSNSRQKSASDSPAKRGLSHTSDANNFEDLFEEPLEDHGLMKSIEDNPESQDVSRHIQYVRDKMFDQIPPRSGMNSTRTAEVLNFQKDIPPLVSLSHILSLSRSPTTTEREIAELMRNGIIRRVSVPLRGVGSDAIGEGLVLTKNWVAQVQGSHTLDDDIKERYIEALRSNPTSTTISAKTLYPSDAQALIQAGFLTSSATVLPVASSALRPSASSGALRYLSTAGTRAATGSMAAVGGQSAIYDAGGGGSGDSSITEISYAFCLPNFGTYLKLLSSARQHLITLLSKTRYKEMPLDLLGERWDVSSANVDKRTTGKSLESTILPVRTKKWKHFYGLNFKWVVQECAGSGAIELFNTGSVGIGVRLNA